MEIKNIILIAILIFGMVYMQFIHAETVDEIIIKYAHARGGITNLNAITSIHMQGVRQMIGSNVNIKITAVKGLLYRNDFEYGTHTGYLIVTPDAGWWCITAGQQKAEAIEETRLKALQVDMDIAGPLIDYTAKGHKAQLAGIENIGGKEAYKIKLTLNGGKEIMYFIDTDDYLLIQTRHMSAGISGEDTEREIITDYNNYQSVEGILFAHTISNPGDWSGAGLTTINEIKLNQQVHQSLYKPFDI